MKYVIPGEPTAWARPKTRIRMIGKSYCPWSYDPKERRKQEVKNTLLWQTPVHNQNLPKDQFYHLTLTFYLSAPKSDTTAQRNAKLWGFELPSSKDIDNLIKFVLDCGNQILYPDDRYIISLTPKKLFSETPRTEIEVIVKEKVYLPKLSKDIILQFTPIEWQEYVKDVEEMQKVCSPTHAYLECTDTVDGILAATSALSKFATKYSKKLAKIDKMTQNQKAEHEQPKT